MSVFVLGVAIYSSWKNEDESFRDGRVSVCPPHWHTIPESELEQGDKYLCMPSSVLFPLFHKLLQFL